MTLAERLLRAQIARERGRLDDAVAALDGVTNADPDIATICQARGLLEFARDRAGAAEAALLQAVAKNGTLSEARRGLVDLYAIEGRRNDLIAQFRGLAKTTVLTFDDLYLWCLGRRQDLGPAEFAAKLQSMLANDPGDRTLRLALAENQRRLGRVDEAEESLAPLSAQDPVARAARARLAIDRGAVELADRLLAEGPSGHPALARLCGRLALGRGDITAVSHFRAALAEEPDDRDTLFGLGQSLRASGRANEAAPYLEAARARDHLDWLIQNARASREHDDPKVFELDRRRLPGTGAPCRGAGVVSAGAGARSVGRRRAETVVQPRRQACSRRAPSPSRELAELSRAGSPGQAVSTPSSGIASGKRIKYPLSTALVLFHFLSAGCRTRRT